MRARAPLEGKDEAQSIDEKLPAAETSRLSFSPGTDENSFK